VHESIECIWATATEGDEPTITQRATLQLAANEAMRAALEAVDTAFGLVGASAIRSTHPLQRCFRDGHTIAQHAYFSPAALQRFATEQLDLAQPTFMMEPTFMM
jgi:alkylation response protein AidB-like acyl-CoA dehydrogenase